MTALFALLAAAVAAAGYLVWLFLKAILVLFLVFYQVLFSGLQMVWIAAGQPGWLAMLIGLWVSVSILLLLARGVRRG